jgi:hypothetical protein
VTYAESTLVSLSVSEAEGSGRGLCGGVERPGERDEIDDAEEIGVRYLALAGCGGSDEPEEPRITPGLLLRQTP